MFLRRLDERERKVEMPADLHELYESNDDTEDLSSRLKDAIRIGHPSRAISSLVTFAR